MKKLMFIAAALLFSLGVAAQDDKMRKQDHIMMKDGKVWVWEKGQKTQLTADRTLANGTKISSTGTVTMSDGTSATLANGDMVDMNGVITRKDMKKDKDMKMAK
jgi:hypothetical protein